MLKKLQAALFAAMFLIVSALPALAVQQPRISRLPNGLTVMVIEDHRFPLASVRLYVKAGSSLERPEEAGVSHMLEHMVFKGSATNADVDAMVENAGGYMNAYTSLDQTCYVVDLPSRDWKVAVRAVRDLAFDPLLTQEDLDAEREVVLAELQLGKDNPTGNMYDYLFEAALAGTPYEKPVIGFPETLNALTPDSIRDYMARNYDPREMLLVVVGDVDAAAVESEAISLFGAYENKTVRQVAPAIELDDLQHGFQVVLDEGLWNKAYVALAFPIPGEGSSEMSAIYALGDMLGGDETSLLYRELHIDRPLSDYVGVGVYPMERTGLLYAVAIVDREQLPDYLGALATILAELDSSSFTAEELARAKLNMEDGLLRSMETVSGIADTLGANYFLRRTDPLGEDMLSSMRQVDLASVDMVIDKYINPMAMSLVVIAPADPDAATETDKAAFADSLAKVVAANWPQAADALAMAEDLEASQVVAEAEPEINLEHPEVIDLGQGRTLVLNYDNSLPYVSASLAFLGGNELTPMDKQGLASIVSQVITSATADMDYNAMNAYQADRAAGLWASAGAAGFSLAVDAPVQHIGDMFDLLAQVLNEPVFNQTDIDRVKLEQLSGIASTEESSSGMLNRLLYPFLFKDNVYAQQPDGSLESVAAVSADDIAAFWQEQQGRPWVLSVGGDYDLDQVMALVDKLPVPDKSAVSLSKPFWNDQKTLVVDMPGRDQAAYALIFPTVPYSHEDSAALGLLSESLSGFTGLLFQELREKNSLGYSVSPVLWQDRETGFLGFVILCESANLPKAEEEFLKIAARLAAEPQAQEVIDRAKLSWENSYYTSLQSRSSRLNSFASNVLFGRPVDFGLQRMKQIMELTPEDLQRVAAKYLIPENAYSIQVRP